VTNWERTDVEFEAKESSNPWHAPVCIHCGQPLGMH
jgi:hypothetical protein